MFSEQKTKQQHQAAFVMMVEISKQSRNPDNQKLNNISESETLSLEIQISKTTNCSFPSRDIAIQLFRNRMTDGQRTEELDILVVESETAPKY